MPKRPPLAPDQAANICKPAYISLTDGLVQERRNSRVLAMELRLPCINPSV